MMNNINKQILMSILIIFISMNLLAQETIIIKGTVYNASSRKPLPNAQVSSFFAKKGIVTDENGTFSIEVTNRKATILVKSTDFFDQEVVCNGRKNVNIYLLPLHTFMQAEGYNSIDGYQKTNEKRGTATTIRQQDLSTFYNSPDEGLHGKFAGLKVTSKSGMPGEGALVHLRGIRSIVGENTPMIVIDGMPYLPNTKPSDAISGFSKSIFMPVNMKEIKNITLLKGADAASYGSLGSNGVLLIETEKATDLETKVELETVEGISFINKRIPMLNASQSKSYLGDIGENKYSNPELLVERLPFLLDDPENRLNYLYANQTKWQDEIYAPALTSENILKVKGGDAIAKYMLTLGTQQNKGAVKSTYLGKYFIRLNADISFSQKLTTSVFAVLNYSDFDVQEQGMALETNPLLTAMHQAPFMSVYKLAYQPDGSIKKLPFFNPVNTELGISNPAAIVSDLKATNRSYDILVNLGFNYNITSQLNVNGMFGLFYNYSKDDIFIPGKNSKAIAPIQDSIAKNTVRSEVYDSKNYYARIVAKYQKTFDVVHDVNIAAGYQLLTSRAEYDMGQGVNTPTDFYTMLGNTTFSKKVSGVMDQWSWMNAYLNVNYAFNKQLYLTGAVALDGASSYGQNSGRWFVFPTVKGAWKIKESPLLRNVDFVSNLMLRGEFGINGNSRYSSRLGKYSYEAEPYRSITGVYRNTLPNTKLEPEKVFNTALGVDFALIGNRINLSVDLYREQTKDMIVANPTLAVYGFDFRHDNSGKIDTKGIEASLSASIINQNNWNWTLGGTIAHYKSKIKSLGSNDEKLFSFSDGTQLLMKVGESPYQFYGNRAEKVFYSTREANTSSYRAHNGNLFVAGDIKFFDKNQDKVINDKDRVILGDPTPDFYGSFYSNLTWKNIRLYMNFTYSYGNEIYNAVRRSNESMKDFSNQDHTVARRWMVEGQETDVPRASYGDRTGNSRFSSRWIEDGSYLRLKEIMLSYDWDKRAWIFNSIRVYLTGENLLTFTKYLGMDPEFSYSYDPQLFGMDLGKMPLSKNIKLGLVLNF